MQILLYKNTEQDLNSKYLLFNYTLRITFKYLTNSSTKFHLTPKKYKSSICVCLFNSLSKFTSTLTILLLSCQILPQLCHACSLPAHDLSILKYWRLAADVCGDDVLGNSLEIILTRASTSITSPLMAHDKLAVQLFRNPKNLMDHFNDQRTVGVDCFGKRYGMGNYELLRVSWPGALSNELEGTRPPPNATRAQVACCDNHFYVSNWERTRQLLFPLVTLPQPLEKGRQTMPSRHSEGFRW